MIFLKEGDRVVPINFSSGVWGLQFANKMGVAPMIKEYLSIREGFVNVCNKLTSLSLRRSS